MTLAIRKTFDGHDRETFQLNLDPVSLTHQSEAAACDINQIMKRFERTGILEHRNTFEGQYGDFTDLPLNYHDSMNACLAAQDMFLTLPSGIRKRFGNDPGIFLEFVANPANGAEMVKMGLATARPDPDTLVETQPKAKPAVPPPGKPPAPPASPSKAETE